MKVLGISAFYHDSSAALVEDGRVLAAIQLERLSRKKHDSDFPVAAIEECLKLGKLTLSQVDAVVFYEKPLLRFERIIESYFMSRGRGFAFFAKTLPLWFKEKLFQKQRIVEQLKKLDRQWNGKLYFSEHHLSHAASSYYPSEFAEAVVLVNDGVGEWDTTTVFKGEGAVLKKIKAIHFPHSLGLLYSAFTYYLGFKVNEGEYKVMGLAPYGKPIYKDLIVKKIVKQYADGSYCLDMSYFSYLNRFEMISKKFERLFGQPRRVATDAITQFHMDVASSLQEALEDVVFNLLTKLHQEFGCDNLCLAGGVALNCVLNGKIVARSPFKKVWIQPAAGDAGGSLGAALAYLYAQNSDCKRVNFETPFLGREFSDADIEHLLKEQHVNFTRLDDERLISKTAEQLAAGKVIGWYQGRSEFGPRALGNRSILADPRSIEMQKRVNLKIKFRESFRPFAPAVLEEESEQWFDFIGASPYMLMTAQVQSSHIQEDEQQSALRFIDSPLFKVEREVGQFTSEIGAVTHIDRSARLQTVSEEDNKKFYHLIKAFYHQTGVPMVLNTSFNINKMPIVDSPQDAWDCFLQTEMDVLVLGNYYVERDVSNAG